MLVLRIKEGESVFIGDNDKVIVHSIRNDRVRIDHGNERFYMGLYDSLDISVTGFHDVRIKVVRLPEPGAVRLGFEADSKIQIDRGCVRESKIRGPRKG